jgi:hypothetical protein
MRLTLSIASFLALSLAARGQISPPTFPDPFAIPATSVYPECKSLAAGDFDGDGSLDAAVLMKDGQQVRVYRGQGRDGFLAPWTTILPLVANRVQAGDMNGDGWTDLVLTLDSGSVLVLLANQQGTLTALPAVALGLKPTELALGDLDGDGDLDAVVTLWNDNRLAFCSNNGSGVLTPYLSLLLPSTPLTVAMGHLDGNGALDVVVGIAAFDCELRVLFNDGTGHVPTSASLFVGQTLDEVEIADFNGDSHQDLSWRSTPNFVRSLQISHGDGAGGFATPVTLMTGLDSWHWWTDHGDIDHDGDEDLAVSDASGRHYIVRNDGGGLFTSTAKNSVDFSQEGRLIDFDGDGHLDLLIGGDNVQVLFGDGQAGFTPLPACILPRNPSLQVTHADIDGDSNQDVIVGGFTSNASFVSICFGDGQGGISAVQDVALGVDGFFTNPGAADWDGDGDPDVVAATAHSGTVVLRNDSGVLSVVGTLDAGLDDERWIETADFDGDGLTDVLLTRFTAQTHTVYRSLGDGTFAVLHTAHYSKRGHSSTIAELNGDGKPDFVIGTTGTGFNSGDINVWLSQGSSYVLSKVFPFNGTVIALTAGDFDADGDNDLGSLIRASNGGPFYSNDGLGNLTQALFMSVPAFTQRVQAADMDSDGDADVLAWEDPNRSVGLYSSKGNWTFDAANWYFAGGESFGDVADMNNDGRLDLIATYKEGFDTTVVRVMLQSQGPVWIYCAPKTNSLGCVPQITHSGTPSATSGSGFLIGANRIVSGVPGLLFYGLSGQNATAFQGGLLCVQPPLVRMSAQNSGGSGNCTGVFSTDFNAYIASGQNPALVAGQRVCGQWWSRDNGFAPPANTNLTDAIDFVIQP